MPNPLDERLRARAVRAYEAGRGTHDEIADLFGVGTRTLQRWVARWRTGERTARPKRGGWRSPIDLATLEAVLADAPDATCAELCWAYNRRVARAHQTTPTSLWRALRRAGYVVKKNRPRPSEVDRPDVRRQRAAFVKWRRRVDPKRLVFLDEAGAHLAMGRSHVWVKRGTEYVEPRPMNWGTNLTLIGAIRQRGWVTLGTQWTAATAQSFVTWVRRRLAPCLQPGDVVVLDNLRAHKDPRIQRIIARRGARLRFLPPYSYDFNPIEAAWGLVKKRIRAFAPRTPHALRRLARAARHVVTTRHCRQWFAHAGYANSSTIRG